MKQKTVYKISVFLAVIGLTLMYASSLYIETEKSDIGDIEKSWTGRTVKIEGNITSYSRSGGNAFMDVKDTSGSIFVVDFESDTDLEEGDRVEVTGNVELYEGELEVIAESIETAAGG